MDKVDKNVDTFDPTKWHVYRLPYSSEIVLRRLRRVAEAEYLHKRYALNAIRTFPTIEEAQAVADRLNSK